MHYMLFRVPTVLHPLRCSCLPPSPLSSFLKNPNKISLTSLLSSSQRCTMASGRTVADVLMGASRAAAAKKNRQALSSQSENYSSPIKKHKVLEPPSATDEPKKLETTDILVELRKKGSDFDPKAAASWKDGDPVPFIFLARALDLISNESGRIAITDIICNVFRTVMATTPNDLLPTVYLSANRVAPPHEGIELGIGDASLIKALAEAYGRKEEHVNKQLQELGDLGLVAKASRSSQRVLYKPQRLTITKVFDTFRAIAKESGKDSQDKKRSYIKGLLVAATDCEPLYIIRLLQSKMRIGLAEKTVLVALGQASVYSEALKCATFKNYSQTLEEAAKIIKQVYSVLPDYGKIVPALLHVGVLKLSEACNFSLGVPVGPMLAKPTKSVSEILDKFQGTEFTCEYKYDGERAQIHYMEDGSIEVYSRNAERNTGKYPDVVSAVSRFKNPEVSSFVLDCEIVAFDREKQKILPFQELYNSFAEVPGEFRFATTITSNDLEEIQKFLEKAVSSSVGDTLDLVPIAAFHGRGKRTGVYGSFLLACYDEQNDEYQSICNIGTGFSELQLEERSKSLGSKVIPKPKPYYRVADSMNPDVWFEPAEVWEVKAADLSISPVHRAASGIVDPNKGISLRFPRLQRVRDDKSPEQATTSEQVAEMYRAQKINHMNNNEEEDDE
ncbi:DNA ligase 1 [Dendrobium catenatum]|uniref:DNA ligase n=1 Tax=Dendrobium catenatum TaxID=906689 RepID=A0A2I0VMG1_9ASPA|nr:DNA ligase 1 [Dendrobium catenatum]